MRIVALDLLRFFSAMSVVLYHYVSRPESNVFPVLREFTQFGYLGVPLFFIISGYVIALSANNRTAVEFLISRFVRLYPTLWVGVIFTVCVVSWLTVDNYSLMQIVANFTQLNLYMGYGDIDGVYWTIKAELKFYFCVFLLVLFGVFQKYHIWLSVWLVFTVMHLIFGQPFFMGWFISPEYSSFFIAGVVFYLLQTKGHSFFNHALIMLTLIISVLRAYDQADFFMVDPDGIEKNISAIVVLCFYGVMFLLCTGKLPLKSCTLFTSLGALTYPLYLIHNVAGKAIIDYFSTHVVEEIAIFSVTLLMVTIAWLIHWLIERPLANPMKHYLILLSQRMLSRS